MNLLIPHVKLTCSGSGAAPLSLLFSRTLMPMEEGTELWRTLLDRVKNPLVAPLADGLGVKSDFLFYIWQKCKNKKNII